jgi:hypothetical protein
MAMLVWLTLVNKRNGMWLKETRVVVLIPHRSQHLSTIKMSRTTSWMFMRSLMWAQCKVDTYSIDGMCAHTSKNTYY